jgi:hypothetical protein
MIVDRMAPLVCLLDVNFGQCEEICGLVGRFLIVDAVTLLFFCVVNCDKSITLCVLRQACQRPAARRRTD